MYRFKGVASKFLSNYMACYKWLQSFNIEEYFEETAMFRWRITDFEDKGSYWDIPAEDISMFQIFR